MNFVTSRASAVEKLNKFTEENLFEYAKLRNFGMTIGIRDTRKINAQYNMTSEDVHGQAKFDDSVGIFPEFIDGYGTLVLPTTGRYYQIPYRTLLPKKVKNLIAAGRITGGDKTSHASTRNMMCCTVTGQAAGVAAALSSSLNKNLDEVPLVELKKSLKNQAWTSKCPLLCSPGYPKTPK